MTTSSLSDSQLKQQIRVRLAHARLPAVDGVYKAQRGTGQPCVVCRRAIEPTEVQYEVNRLDVVLIAHGACYALWREESLSRG